MNNLELKKIRKALGITQVQMAEKLGVSPRGYQNWEQGDRKIPTPTVYLIRNMLKEDNTNNNAKNTYLLKDNTKFGIGEAVNLILENLDEAKKIPVFAMFIKTIEQETRIKADKEHYQTLLNLTKNEQ